MNFSTEHSRKNSNFWNFCWMIRTQSISLLKLFLLYCVAWPPGNSVGMRCFLLHNLLFMANLRRRLWRIPEDTYYIHTDTEYANITHLFFGAQTWISATPLGDRMHLSSIHWFFFSHFFFVATGEKCFYFNEVCFFHNMDV